MKSLSSAVIVAFLACASNSTTSAVEEIVPGEPFRLEVGGKMRLAVEDLTVRFVAVKGDSRCPTEVVCEWAGDAVVEVRLTRGGEKTALELHTHYDYPREAEAFGWTVRLEDLEPQPSIEATTARDYVATFKLTRPSEQVAEITPGEPFRLGVGAEGRLAAEDLTVRFVGVTADSRCPTDVTCFWAGDAEAEVRLTRGDEEATVSVHSHGGERHPREAGALGCSLRLEDVEPYPSSKRKIAPEDYVATLMLTLEEPSESD